MACCRSHLPTRRPHLAAEPGPRPAQRPGGGAGGVRVGGVPAPQLRPRHRRGHQRRHQRSVVHQAVRCLHPPVVAVSCAAWQLRLWTVDKMTGARESVDLMCGQDARREYTVPRCSAVQCSAVQCSAVQYSNSTLCPGASPGSSTSRCPASTRGPSTTASPGTPPGLCCQTASSSRSDVTVNNNI